MDEHVTDRFRSLHDSGTFVIPNPFDRGSARLLASLGFAALATTSAGLAASLGRRDMTIDREDLVAHVAVVASATDLPLHVDAERCFGDDPAGVAETVHLLAHAGAAGCSIEDWNPAEQQIDPLATSVARVAAAAEAAAEHGLVLTARCEHHLHGVDDLDATIERLVAYREAGAEVLYAPGYFGIEEVARIVAGAGAPVNVLLLPGGPTVAELTEAGVRRVSLGGGLSNVAYGAVVAQATAIRDHGTPDLTLPSLSRDTLAAAFEG